MSTAITPAIRRLSQKKIDRYFVSKIETAKTICSQISYRDALHCSFIFRRGRLLAIGTNERKTHPEAQKHGYMFSDKHSEYDAWIRIPYTLRDSLVLVNFRFNRRGEMRNSCPCELCKPWCVELFDEIYHSSNEGMIDLRSGETVWFL